MREPARSSVITLRVSVELATRVRAAATDRGVTVNWFAGKLLAEALDDLEPHGKFRLTRAKDRVAT